MPLLDAIPRICGLRGRPRHRPRRLFADRSYDYDKYRRLVRTRGITPKIARRGTPHGSGLGKTRWVVERTFAWRRTARDRAARQAADAQLAARIRAVHQKSDGTYGVPRITAELRETSGEAVNHKRVARIMRESGIEGVRLRHRHRTTVPDPAAAKAPDLIGRDFTAKALNTKHVGDIT
ncbi:transposase InsO family protein [Streptomyces candidus]|uniref:Transposase InsO family protein n=1 Tax=Streptomyces candidus TaxID=67283 RepID=A0A7X0LTP6_9ACTN|nr:transposase InsO family protein [Streptomyces candidus]GHH56311.1 hypothetical protein GCM10018773_62120 [Streptomyces candidus]